MTEILNQIKYKIGDTAYCAEYIDVTYTESCPDCLGSKEWPLVLPSGESIVLPCATCEQQWSPSGVVYKHMLEPVVRTVTIGSIRLDTNDRTEPISYMAIETGVGTGRVYYQSDLFDDYRLALAAANALIAKRLENAEKENKTRKKRRKPEWWETRIKQLEKELKTLKGVK